MFFQLSWDDLALLKLKVFFSLKINATDALLKLSNIIIRVFINFTIKFITLADQKNAIYEQKNIDN